MYIRTYVRTYVRYVGVADRLHYGVTDSLHNAFLDPCFYDNGVDGDDDEDANNNNGEKERNTTTGPNIANILRRPTHSNASRSVADSQISRHLKQKGASL